MLIRPNCCEFKLLRSVSLTLVIMVLRIVFRSSAPNSVNMTPTTEFFLYQPVTSVSRVDRESAERILSKAFPFLSDRRPSPHIQEHQQEGLSRALCSLSLERNHPVKGFLIQNAAFLNRKNVCRKCIQICYTVEPPYIHDSLSSSCFLFRAQEQMTYSEAALCFLGGVQNWELQTN